MGFSKAMDNPNVEIVVGMPYDSEGELVFTFAKRQSRSAKDADARFVALLGKEGTPEQFRTALIETVSEMMAEAPKGFDDFPMDERPLSERVREYFDAPELPELETILAAALRQFRISSQAIAHVRLPEREGN